MNWPVIIAIGVAAFALIGFLIWQNKKDKNRFENQLKNDYPKPKDEEGDIEIDEEIK